jgi:hypothetical protein
MTPRVASDGTLRQEGIDPALFGERWNPDKLEPSHGQGPHSLGHDPPDNRDDEGRQNVGKELSDSAEERAQGVTEDILYLHGDFLALTDAARVSSVWTPISRQGK